MARRQPQRGAESQRLYFVQWLRVLLISLVVAHHAGQPYGPTGGKWPVHDAAQTPWLGPFFALNAAFFMGFFFLIAGYFTASSYDRKGPPSNRAILIYALTLGVIGAVVRTRYPQDVWVNILWLVPAELAHLPQYVSLFVIGIVAGRGGWFTKITSAAGRLWFAIGVAAFVAAMACYAAQKSLPAFVNLQVAWGFLEAFVCVGMILGLTVLFRRYCAKPSAWLNRLDGNVYGVYLIQVFVVVAVQMAIAAVPMAATGKFLLVTIASLAICFSVVAAVRQIPLISRVV